MGQTGLFLFNSTVKFFHFVPFVPVTGRGSSLGRLSLQGRQKNVYVFSVYWFFSAPIDALHHRDDHMRCEGSGQGRQSGFFGRGCDEALFSVKKGFFQ